MQKSFGPFEIRDWQVPDRQTAADLIASVLAEFGLGWDPLGTDQDVINVETAYRQGAFWVVETAGQLVGTAGYYPVSRGADLGMNAVEIRKMYLAPSVRGQGLGRWLLAALENQIQTQGYSHIWIETLSAMEAATYLYESSGYQRHQEVFVSRCDRSYLKVVSP
jgi:putative acetyltransferase